jgi:opacity protein-like surface antigen
MFNRNVGAELTYDVNFRNQGRDGHAVMVNGIYQRGIAGTPMTPYILAGVGMGMGNWITAPNESITGLYNVGGGVKYAVARNVDLDLRYRYMASWNTPGYHANVVTAGIAYRF